LPSSGRDSLAAAFMSLLAAFPRCGGACPSFFAKDADRAKIRGER